MRFDKEQTVQLFEEKNIRDVLDDEQEKGISPSWMYVVC